MSKTIFISGPITNNPFAKEDFAIAENYLKGLGYNVINPMIEEEHTYREYINIGLEKLMSADEIFMLRGWAESHGSSLEWNYAMTVGMPVKFQSSCYGRC